MIRVAKVPDLSSIRTKGSRANIARSVTIAVATETTQSARCPGDQPAEYLNSGNILRPSLVPPGSMTFLSLKVSVS